MAGIHFDFKNFYQLVSLNIGIAERLDENRAESFTILYCDFDGFEKKVIKSSLENVLRDSDAITNFKKDYFFVLPYTDKYGAKIVKKMFDEFFGREIKSFMVSYPKDGEFSKMLFEELQNGVSTAFDKSLTCLD